MAEPLLEIRDLKVEFSTRHGTVTALDGIDLDVLPGETLGIVGEIGMRQVDHGTCDDGADPFAAGTYRRRRDPV